MLKESVRVTPGENPLEGFTRIRGERLKEVGDYNITVLAKGFMAKLNETGKLLRNTRFSEKFSDYPADESLGYEVQLSFHNSSIAVSKITFRKREDKLEAVIESMHGLGWDRSGITHFEKENSQLEDEGRFVDKYGRLRWFLVFAGSIVSAAHSTGFDRVLLVDITKTEEYKRPSIARSNRSVPQVQNAMRDLYGLIREECGFSKKEGGYFVREFP
jgi:hypothetical protein